MRIPSKQETTRFYVAISEKEAFSSWDTYEEAFLSYLRMKKYQPANAKCVIGIVQIYSSCTQVLHRFDEEFRRGEEEPT